MLYSIASFLFVAFLAFTVSAEDNCKLSKLELGTGAELSFEFREDWTNYFCSCLYNVESTTVTAYPYQANIGLSLFLNQQPITPFNPFVASPSLPLAVGDNTVDIVLTGETCGNTYTITCTRQPPSGGDVQGDPQFTGLRGQSYQIHGVAGEIYNLVTDNEIQVNSKFVFLTKGKCPVINGKRAKVCFAHPGSYLGEIGIKTINGDKIKLVSGSAASGFKSVTVNGVELGLQQTLDLSNSVQISRNGSHIVTFTGSTFTFEFENSDLFINQKVSVNDWENTKSHGLLGQTWNTKTYAGKIKFIEGSVDDYLVQSNDLFGDDFVFNQFQTKTA